VSSPPKILVFDSGLGGLTVLREIVRTRPDAHYVYVADDAFFPYGHHSEEQIIARVVPLVGELIARHAPALVVIACNTASTLVMSHLRSAYSAPFVGTVPAIKPACASSKTKRVSVLGTKGTVKREYTRRLIEDFAQGCDVTLVGSAELASLAESALSGNDVRDADIAAELAPCFVGDGADRTDTVVLACTHYPLLLERLKRLAPWPDRLDRSGARDRPARLRAARLARPAKRRRRRRDDLHLAAAAHAERRADAVLRRARAGVRSNSPAPHLFVHGLAAASGRTPSALRFLREGAQQRFSIRAIAEFGLIGEVLQLALQQ
jgi:glutamate racemase